MKHWLTTILFVLTFSLFAVLSAGASGGTVEAPGGSVTSMEELYQALGGENAVEQKEDHLLLRHDICLKAPIVITKGEYLLVGAGVEITASFNDKHLFVIGDPDGKQEVALILGTPDNTSENDDLICNGKNETREGSFFSILPQATVAVFPGTVFKDCVSSLSGAVVESSGSFMMYGGSMINCRALTAGGAISSKGTLYLAAGTVSHCSSELGGAIYNEGKCSLIGTEIIACMAGSGGSVYNGGSLELLSSSLSECIALKGGAIYNAKGGTATLSGGQILSCGSEKDTNGGAVYNDGTLTVAGTYCSENKGILGGTVFNASVLSMESGNLYNGSAKNGGHIYNDSFAEFTLSGGSISSGSADSGGGLFNVGTFYMKGGSFSGNRAAHGGAVLNEGKMTMTATASVNPRNDVFVLITDDNTHAIHFEGVSPAETIVVITPGITTENGYTTSYSENAVLATGAVLGEGYERIAITSPSDNLSYYLTADGTLARHLPVYYHPYFYVILLIAFAATVSVIVVTVRFFDNKRTRASH